MHTSIQDKTKTTMNNGLYCYNILLNKIGGISFYLRLTDYSSVLALYCYVHLHIRHLYCVLVLPYVIKKFINYVFLLADNRVL